MFRTCSLIIASGLFLSSCALAATVGPSQEEKAKQDEFLKAYNNPDKLERMKALQLLSGLGHATTVQLLFQKYNSDPDKEVKLEACRLLSKAPIHDPSMSQNLANIFNSLKPNDIETRLAVAKDMANSAFKYCLVEALVAYGSNTLCYPNLITSATTGTANTEYKKQRADFESFIAVFNEVTGADMKAVNRTSPGEVKKWWELNRNKFMQADKDLASKYKAEDQANPAEGDKPK